MILSPAIAPWFCKLFEQRRLAISYAQTIVDICRQKLRSSCIYKNEWFNGFFTFLTDLNMKFGAVLFGSCLILVVIEVGATRVKNSGHHGFNSSASINKKFTRRSLEKFLATKPKLWKVSFRFNLFFKQYAKLSFNFSLDPSRTSRSVSTENNWALLGLLANMRCI